MGQDTESTSEGTAFSLARLFDELSTKFLLFLRWDEAVTLPEFHAML